MESDSPSAVVWRQVRAINDGIAKGLVGVVDAHLGTKTPPGALRRSLGHLLEVLEVVLDAVIAMLGGDAVHTLLAHLLLLGIVRVRLACLDHLQCKLVQLIEVVARIRDLPWLETQPSYSLQDALKVLCLFRLRVRVVVPQVRLAAVERRVAKVDKDRLRVANVEVAIGLGRETRVDEPAGRGKVLLAEVRVDLGVLAGFMQGAEEALLEDGFAGGGRVFCNLCLRCFCGFLGLLRGVRWMYVASGIETRTLALGFAASLAPNFSVKAASTAFLTSSGLAQRSSGEVFRPPITAPRFAQPVTAAVVM